MPIIDVRSRLLSGAEGGFFPRNDTNTTTNANHDSNTTAKVRVGQNSSLSNIVGSIRFQSSVLTHAESLFEFSAPLTHHHSVHRQNDRAEHVGHTRQPCESASADQRQRN